MDRVTGIGGFFFRAQDPEGQPDSEMIGPPEHTWMINFRVADLDAFVEQLRAAGEGLIVEARTVTDPAGHRIRPQTAR